MTTPTNHHMTVTDHHGKQVRGKVIYVEPKAKRWHPQSAVEHIVTSGRLDPYGYRRIYISYVKSVSGWFNMLAYAHAGGSLLGAVTIQGCLNVEDDPVQAP